MKANYVILDKSKPDRLIIRDIGPWEKFATVTNAAEDVVEELVAGGYLPPGRRLFYYDSEDACDEIVVVQGKFAGFICGTSA